MVEHQISDTESVMLKLSELVNCLESYGFTVKYKESRNPGLSKKDLLVCWGSDNKEGWR